MGQLRDLYVTWATKNGFLCLRFKVVFHNLNTKWTNFLGKAFTCDLFVSKYGNDTNEHIFHSTLHLTNKTFYVWKNWMFLWIHFSKRILVHTWNQTDFVCSRFLKIFKLSLFIDLKIVSIINFCFEWVCTCLKSNTYDCQDGHFSKTWGQNDWKNNA